MLENIVRHMEMGKSPLAAALVGSAGRIHDCVHDPLPRCRVIPFLFMGGIVGRLFHEFAVTIGVAVLISGLVSLTLTPMLCSRYLRPSKEAHHGKFYEVSERWFQRSVDFYGRTLTWVLEHRRPTLIVSAVMLVLTVYFYVEIPKGFLPSSDTGQIFGFTEAAQGISFESMAQHQQEVASVLQKDENIDQFMSNCGSRGGITSGNTGILFMRLVPRRKSLSADEDPEPAPRLPRSRASVWQNLRLSASVADEGLYQFAESQHGGIVRACRSSSEGAELPGFRTSRRPAVEKIR
jgi:HAE1 family hydrophobic/amphiphilic exporter-1